MILDNENKCASCGMCVVACPKKCLDFKLNDEGFYRPQPQKDSCVNCGLCDEICPTNVRFTNTDVLGGFSFKSKDKDVLSTTSSGGFCYEIAKQHIIKGKKVCACVYDYNKHIAKHKVITKIKDLEETKGSKYFQSYTVEAFNELFDGKEWVVFGTPCQIAAIDSITTKRKIRHNYLLIDFFCHGTPSMNLWEKYILENGKDQIEKINFRSKEFGWHNFSLKFIYKDKTRKSDYKDNMFYKLFFNNLCLNDSCYECNYKAFQSKADIRVGDFWGDKYKEDNKGVSCCLILTNKGKECADDVFCQGDVKEENIEDIIERQMKKSPPLRKERKKLLNALKGNKKLKTINYTTLFLYRIKCKAKSLLLRK